MNVRFLKDGQHIGMFYDHDETKKNFNTYDLSSSIHAAEARFLPRKFNERLPTKLSKKTIALNPYYKEGPRFERVLQSLNSGKKGTTRTKNRNDKSSNKYLSSENSSLEDLKNVTP